jgi:tRNA nucleotidyltransferase (CCA-adding enzyme)
MYIVGGFMRDLLLERPGLDFDLVVEGDAIAVGQALCSQFGGRLTTHTRFGTAKWLIAELRGELASALGYPEGAADLPEFLDIITARTEFYTHPTALPTVERGSIKLDLHRRDFTINTLALRLDGHHYGELHDHWGGLNDLRDGLVRVLHSLSFVDDPTRMLRAVRFEQRFGFQVEARTLELLREALSLMGRVSGDRLRHELDHILDEERRVAMLERLHALGLLAAIHPVLPWDDWLHERLDSLDDLETGQWEVVAEFAHKPLARRLAYSLWLMRLPVEPLQAVVERLRIPAVQARDIQAARQLWDDLPGLVGAAPSQVVDRLQDVPLLAIYANYLAVQDTNLRSVLKNYLTTWRKLAPSTTGHDLLARASRLAQNTVASSARCAAPGWTVKLQRLSKNTLCWKL